MNHTPRRLDHTSNHTSHHTSRPHSTLKTTLGTLERGGVATISVLDLAPMLMPPASPYTPRTKCSKCGLSTKTASEVWSGPWFQPWSPSFQSDLKGPES